MEMFIVASIVTTLFGVVVWLTIFKRKRGFSQARKSHYVSELKSALNMEPTLGYITTDRILEQMLSELHGKAPLGENLKSHYHSHIRRDDLWKMHKVRNRVVHEGSVAISSRQVEEFVRLVKSVLI